MADLWYRDAVIYSLDVEKYADSDGDGVGDLRGVIERLDHVAGLGATCLWLLPFFPSPRRDAGYDVTDYMAVDPRFGTLDDLQTLVTEAGERGLRVMIDIVMAHSSDEHPWFLASRRDARSRYRDYYLWTDHPPPVPPEAHGAFPGEEDSLWTYDHVAGAYYYHRFYRFQPQLDLANPKVREEVVRVMDFWLSLGVSGFRLDALPMMVGDDPAIRSRRQGHDWLRELRSAAERQRSDVALLGEVDLSTDQLVEYFGEGDEANMLFDFFLNGYLWLALAKGDKRPLLKALAQLPSGPPSCQWVNFLRNLDELNLGWLDEKDREAVFSRFAPDDDMRIYGRGVRRRVAPMLRDRRLIELAWVLMFAMPGTPLLAYGDEIGLGEDLDVPGRGSVRVPMQWSAERNGGFSSASASALVGKPVAKGDFSFRKVNVRDQDGDPDSLLSFMWRLIAARRSCPEFGLGEWHAFLSEEPEVMAHHCVWRNGHVIAVHNLSERKKTVSLDVKDHERRMLVEIIGRDCSEEETDEGVYGVQLGPYGYKWYRVHAVESTGRVNGSW